MTLYRVGFSITVHSKDQPYQSQISTAIAKLIDIVGPGEWEEESATERTYRGNNRSKLWFRVVEQIEMPWVSHYLGHGRTLRPGFEFDEDNYVRNHGWCEAKEYVQLYEGSLYKCPTMAVLKNTLETHNYMYKEAWEPWMEYKALTTECNDDTISAWITRQKGPEKYCNMCFGIAPIESKYRVHTIKARTDD
jgi:hypothetical protein